VTGLLDSDGWEISRAVRAREVSAAEVARAALERVSADAVGAVWRVTEERALGEAAALDARIAAGEDLAQLPLIGVPVGWKDLIDTGGITTTYGSALYRDHLPQRDAEVVENLRAAGAITVAKLATHELAWGTTTQNPHFGSCRNPHDPTRVPGGSSGGSGAALATRAVAAAPGTDTGGSIRCPASCCGVVGLKPTYGRVSLAGIRPLCTTLDHCGPMGRSVRDCALQLEALTGWPARDPRVVDVPRERWSEGLDAGVRGRRVGVAERYFFEHTAPDVAARARAAVDALAHAGAEIVEVDLEWPTPLGEGDPFIPEGVATLKPFWPARRAELGPDVLRDCELSSGMDAVDFAETNQIRLEYTGRMLERMAAEGIELIVTPTQAQSPPRIGLDTIPYAGRPDEDVTYAMCGLTVIFNMLGWPAISVPCGCDDDGLPAGVQIAALPWRERYCFAAAAVVEAAAL
jgi:aspartyl-tRNA(Asn)/glutamyl-tRNA(Gln) amidotransferase subunit A